MTKPTPYPLEPEKLCWGYLKQLLMCSHMVWWTFACCEWVTPRSERVCIWNGVHMWILYDKSHLGISCYCVLWIWWQSVPTCASLPLFGLCQVSQSYCAKNGVVWGRNWRKLSACHHTTTSSSMYDKSRLLLIFYIILPRDALKRVYFIKNVTCTAPLKLSLCYDGFWRAFGPYHCRVRIVLLVKYWLPFRL